MAPKRKQTSTMVNFDSSKFVSELAWKRFNATKKKGFIMERQLRITVQWHPDIDQVISTRGWLSFCEQPELAILPMVREFYANSIKQHKGKIFVRGKQVTFSSSDINSIYGLPNVAKDEYSLLCAGEVNLDDVLKVIAVPGTVWKVYNDSAGEVLTIKKNSLVPAARVWLYFICCRLAPTKHLGDVTIARAILIYAIMKGSTIDVGKILADAILENIDGHTHSFWFPALITSLCKKAGVQWDDNEEKVYIKSPLDNLAIKKIKKGSIITDGVRSSSSDKATESSNLPLTIDQRLQHLEHRQRILERRQERYAKQSEARDMALAAMLRACATHMQMDMTSFPVMPPPEPETNEEMEDGVEDAQESV